MSSSIIKYSSFAVALVRFIYDWSSIACALSVTLIIVYKERKRWHCFVSLAVSILCSKLKLGNGQPNKSTLWCLWAIYRIAVNHISVSLAESSVVSPARSSVVSSARSSKLSPNKLDVYWSGIRALSCSRARSAILSLARSFHAYVHWCSLHRKYWTRAYACSHPYVQD